MINGSPINVKPSTHSYLTPDINKVLLYKSCFALETFAGSPQSAKKTRQKLLMVISVLILFFHLAIKRSID